MLTLRKFATKNGGYLATFNRSTRKISGKTEISVFCQQPFARSGVSFGHLLM